jgi:hypothetical protein
MLQSNKLLQIIFDDLNDIDKPIQPTKQSFYKRTINDVNTCHHKPPMAPGSKKSKGLKTQKPKNSKSLTKSKSVKTLHKSLSKGNFTHLKPIKLTKDN